MGSTLLPPTALHRSPGSHSRALSDAVPVVPPLEGSEDRAPRCVPRVVVTIPQQVELRSREEAIRYASAEYRAPLGARGLTASMSLRGNCYDNAVVESLFATVKHGLGAMAHWRTRDAAAVAVLAVLAVAEFIEIWYNRQRRRSPAGYLGLAAYEAQQSSAATVRRAA